MSIPNERDANDGRACVIRTELEAASESFK